MIYNVVSAVKNSNEYDCLFFPVINNKIPSVVNKIDTDLVDDLQAVILKSLGNAQRDVEIVTQQSLSIDATILLLYFDDENDLEINNVRAILSKAIGFLRSTEFISILVCLGDLKSVFNSSTDYYLQLTRAFEETTYHYTEIIKNRNHRLCIKNVVYFESQNRCTRDAHGVINKAKNISQGINYSKQLSNLPANVCTPTYLAKQAVSLAKHNKLKTRVFNENRMKALGMNLILAVSKGSYESAKLITIEYQGADLSAAPIILIGKGLTFDSGGYSLKSAPAMDEMKFDMCGGAVVLGTMLAVAKMNLPVNVTAVIPASENLVDGNAFKPGDVLTSMSGQTVEILSTDAEGRLLLADSLTFVKRYRPSLVIDVATLTGACITALGHDISGLMTNNQPLARRLVSAGKNSHDYVWPLPLWQDYEQIFDSNFADMASSAGRDSSSGAGAIIAGSFLSKFATGYRWAHIDMAGPAWLRGKQKGATGRPVALLCQFMLDYCDKPF